MSTATESKRNRTRRWLWPLLVIAALTWGGYWWLSRGRGPDVAVDETAPTSATGGAEEGAANPGSSPQSGAHQKQLDELKRREQFREEWARRLEEFMNSSDQDSVEARQAFEREYEAAQRREHLRRIGEFVDSANRDFAFSFRVLDQEDAPVPDVAVEALVSVAQSDLSEKRETLAAVTDGSGIFRLEGKGISIVLSFRKSGYRFPQVESLALDRMSEAELERLNRGEDQMTIRAWRQPSEPADDVRTGLTYHKVVADGSFRGADIERFRDLVQVSMTRAADGTFAKPSSWSAGLRIRNGEIQETASTFLYEAPESGYGPQWSVSYDKGADDWALSKTHSFFFRSDGGRIHGALTVEFRPYYNVVEESSAGIDYRLNATGSRNLLSTKDR